MQLDEMLCTQDKYTCLSLVTILLNSIINVWKLSQAYKNWLELKSETML